MLLSRLILTAAVTLTALPALANDALLPARPQPATVLAAAATARTPLLAVPAQTASAGSMWDVCRSLPAATDSDDAAYRWRMEAFRQLECVAQAVEQALSAADSEDGTLTLTRDELEQFRTRALWAKDAAARIGR